MKREVKQQRYKLWLLALVLALALAWYTLNPVSATIKPSQREDDPNDAKQRQAQAQTAGEFCALQMLPTFSPAPVGDVSFDEPVDWPEYLDLN